MEREIQIRVAAERDAEALLKIYAPYVERTAITFEYDVPAAEEFAGRIRHVEEYFPYLLAELNGEPVGYTYVSPFSDRPAYAWSVETSIYVRWDCRRQGIGRQLYAALERVLRAQGILNLNACIAYPDPEDEYLTRDSVAFHRRMGYETAGTFHRCGYKFRRWYHMVWMEKHIGDHVTDQPPVLPFSKIPGEQIL